MRNNALDAGKLMASFFIVILHVGFFNEYPVLVGELIRTLARWAVPFFFLTSGYVWGKSYKLKTEEKMNKTLFILSYASIIYAALRLIQLDYNPLRLIADLLGFQLLKGGTYFHLWFMSSLILGLFIVGMLLKNKREPFLKTISLVILFLFWTSDISKSFNFHGDIIYFIRTMQSVAFLYCGYYIAKAEERFLIQRRIAVAIIASSIVLCSAEVQIFKLFSSADISNRQFPLFSAGIAIGLLLLCINTRMRANLFSDIGAKYSLGIYLMHPLYLYFIGEAMKSWNFESSTILLLGSFLISILTMFLIERFMPSLYRRLNGTGIQ